MFRKAARVLIILAGAACIGAGAYLLKERADYKKWTVQEQTKVRTALAAEIPGYKSGTESEAAGGSSEAGNRDASETNGEEGGRHENGQSAAAQGENASDQASSALSDADVSSSVAGISSADDLPVLSVDGIDCIGIVDVPSLQMSVAACAHQDRVSYMAYSASGIDTEGIVCLIGADLKGVFGGLNGVSEGADVVFTDVEGNVHRYQVSSVLTTKDDLPSFAAGEREKSAGKDTGILNLCSPSSGGKWFIAECAEQ